MKTCLNRLIGICENLCQRDYDTNHHPNNYDCKDYTEINLLTFEVQDKTMTELDSIGKLLDKL